MKINTVKLWFVWLSDRLMALFHPKMKKVTVLEPGEFTPSLYDRVLFFCFGEALLNAPCERLKNKLQGNCNAKNCKCRLYVAYHLCSVCHYHRRRGNKYYCEKNITKQALRRFFLKPKEKKGCA